VALRKAAGGSLFVVGLWRNHIYSSKADGQVTKNDMPFPADTASMLWKLKRPLSREKAGIRHSFIMSANSHENLGITQDASGK